MVIEGYEIQKEVSNDQSCELYHGTRSSDGQPVLLKCVELRHHCEPAIALLKRDLDIGHTLDLEGVLPALALTETLTHVVLVLKDPGCVPLDRVLSSAALEVETAIRIVAGLARTLADVHSLGYIHRNIQSHNILVDVGNSFSWITGFGLASKIPRETRNTPHPAALVGSQAYMSPEQTGRTSRLVDYRTDLYSLGVVFFEMLTGRLPFESDDSLTLIHDHVARYPPTPRDINPRIPHMVSEIILKLLSKQAEDRYQSARGLLVDIERVLRDLASHAESRQFSLGEHDVPTHFELPQRLYGREAEMEKLVEMLNTACQGPPQVLLVSGHPGVGKTTLIKRLRQQALLHHGYFAAGKYEELEGGIPFRGLIMAARDIAECMLAESEEVVGVWGRRLVDELKPNLSVILETVPELESILGKQPPAPALGSTEDKRRRDQVWRQFLHVMASPEHPVVLFLDDLQWVDQSSLERIVGLLDKKTKGLLLVGAFRENEVGETHPLWSTVDAIKKKGMTVEIMSLQPLKLDAVTHLVTDTLRCSPEQAFSLANSVYQRSAGNPYYARIFLASLHEEGLLSSAAEYTQRWGLGGNADTEALLSVTDLNSRRIDRLSNEAQQTIALAAAVGFRFDEETLAGVSGLSVAVTESHLVEACQERILLRGEHFFEFEHDRLQKSAYNRIEEKVRPQTHLCIGQFLKERTTDAALPGNVFHVVDHFNLAATALESPEERHEVAGLNLKAGQQAKKGAGFPGAYNYFSSGVALLTPEDWDEQYSLSLGLYTELAEAAFLCGKYDCAQKQLEQIHANARSLLDQISAYEVQISMAQTQLREDEAMSVSLGVLAKLGVDIATETTKEDVEEALIKAQITAREILGRQPDQFREMDDPTKLAASRILLKTSLAAGWTHFPLYAKIACELLQLSAQHGRSPETPAAFLINGGMMSYLLDDSEDGNQLSALGMQMSKTAGATRWQALCQLLFHMTVSPCQSPHTELPAAFASTYHLGMMNGQLVTASTSAYIQVVTGLYSGVELSSLDAQVHTYFEECSSVELERARMGLKRLHNTIRLLLGAEHIEEEGTVLPISVNSSDDNWLDRTDHTAQQVAFCEEMLLGVIFRRSKRVVSTALAADSLPPGAATAVLPDEFYTCLVLLDCAPGAEEEERARYLEIVERQLQRLRHLAMLSPMNYQHRVDLVEAQRLNLLDQRTEAMAMFESAILSARANKFIHEEALANELAAEFYQRMGNERLAGYYLREAVGAFRQWGAHEKVSQLRENSAGLLKDVPDVTQFSRVPQAGADVIDHQTDALDLASIERAVVELSRELDLDSLLSKLMTILLQNTGAQRGMLILGADDEAEVRASGCIDDEEMKASRDSLMKERDDIALSVVRFVSRSLKMLVTGDAALDPRFSRDPYVNSGRVKSILCAPILHQGRTLAFLYLENNRISDAFNESRLLAVQVILSQAAVAIENAKLAQGMRDEILMRRKVEEELRGALKEVADLKNRLEAENLYLQEEIQTEHDFEEIIGGSDVLQRCLYKVDQVANTEATVLILGETGTGKELIARAVHSRSPRSGRPLVKVNCAALPRTLIESELFGHEKGAFTGAINKKIGRFELANGGSIFLDEIGDLPLDLQSKLLRILQEGEFERIGSSTTLKVDVRVIAATNQNLEKAVAEGEFRSDLYYRLKVFPIYLPQLCDRREDILLLAWHFISKSQKKMGKKIEKIPKEAMDRLKSYSWPGNIRELENVIERAVILSSGSTLALDETLGVFEDENIGQEGAQSGAKLDEMEKKHIIKVLQECDGKIQGQGNAAERLGLNPSTLRSRMKKLGIQRP